MRLGPLLAALLLATPASAHEFWLAPSRYRAATGEAVTVRAFTGDGFRGPTKPWDRAHAVGFTARTSRTVDLVRAGMDGDSTWVHFAPSDEGGAMLAYVSGFTAIELPAERFERYLAEDGLDEPLAARRRAGVTGPGRERYRRCAKAWLQGDAPQRAIEPIGLPLEIVPETLPGTAPRLRVRLLWNGSPLANSLVNAWHSAVAADAATRDSVQVAWQGRTDERGEVEVPVVAPGEWLVSTVHMVPSSDPAEADWESTWASLTFQRATSAAPSSGWPGTSPP